LSERKRGLTWRYISTMTNNNNFLIGLCEVGDCESCLFSYCCSCCAMAQSRTYMDNSPPIFNFFCLNHVVGRWLIRESYGISGDACSDCYTATFCPCCAANQVYQTAKMRGSVVENGGREANVNEFVTPLPPPTATVQNYLYSCCCMPCAMGDIMERSFGMPWYLGCACVNVPLARNLMRYEYRIKGNDVLEELVVPCGANCVSHVAQQCIPCSGCFLWAAYATVATQLGLEATAHPRSSGPYLSGSASTYHSSREVDRVSVSPMQVVNNQSSPNQMIQMGLMHRGPPPTAVQVYTDEQPIAVGHLIHNQPNNSSNRPIYIAETMNKL
jgi:Cys-rich protein (TIGR01571 family)